MGQELEKTNDKKIGRTTLGITFIVIGIAVILQLFIKQNIFQYVMMMWPIAFISLGIEILYYSHKKNKTIKYDVLGIFFILVLIIFGSIYSIIHLGITKISESDFILNRPTQYNYTKHFYVEEIDLKIINLADQKINMIVKEDSELESTRVNIKVNTKEDRIDNLRDLFEEYSVYDFIEFDNYNDNRIQIFDYPDWVNSLEIIVYTPDKTKIKCTGNLLLNN